MSLSQDPFSAALDQIPKFREFDIAIVRGSLSPLETTSEFVSTYKAIQTVHPQDPVRIPVEAQFFDFATISPFEQQFSFSHDPLYKEIRNFIVAIYRIFSNRYLPYTLCRRNIKAPAHLTLQIWKFLQKYGLINYKIDEHTRPPSIIPQFDRWPQLIYTVNDKLLTSDQYYKKIHPPAQNNILPSNDICLFMKTPYVSPDKTPTSAEVSGLMSFGNWTRQEMDALIEALKPPQPLQPPLQPQMHQQGATVNANQNVNQNLQVPTGPEAWIRISQMVKTKSPEECAAMVAMMPLSFGAIEYNANQIKNIDGTPHPELRNGETVLKEIALSQNHDLKLVNRAVQAIGNEKAQKIMKGQMVDLPKTSSEAAAIIAFEKMTKNAATVKEMHKARILECLRKTVSVLKQDIQAKKALIEEAKADQFEGRPSESEITSSDEKMWSEQTND
ncbi:SWIRM domain containing protein [Tritrichomonas foetus]|uniref:SWIRM domain containing protein n=1 Tax=Tritrichomonas foetus TaxID=1144522 RepID=A0A1J4KPN4_9EUKA|nr:SWIRM domain containing protein [Tritrichomonas foetus]|eukprot:OHT12864.1 SWIRM domain containing protein [Tritrichomonas foetus]